VSNLRLKHLAQCSMLTMSHPPGSIRGQMFKEKDPALAVTSASVALRNMQSWASLRAHKVCLQLPDTGRITMHQPKSLCSGPKHPTNRGITCIPCRIGKFLYLLELGGCLLVCMRGVTISPRHPVCVTAPTTCQNELVYLETVTRPPRLCCFPIAACKTTNRD
jgi:hypothetical protein